MTTGDQTFSGTSVTERTLSESENEEDDYSDSEEVSEWDSTGGYVVMQSTHVTQYHHVTH